MFVTAKQNRKLCRGGSEAPAFQGFEPAISLKFSHNLWKYSYSKMRLATRKCRFSCETDADGSSGTEFTSIGV
jgi:hypothetical protein